VQTSKDGLRVLFVNGLLGGDFSSLDIGLSVLATWLNKKTRHTGAIADLTFHSRDWRRHLHNEIDRKKPDIIALSCNTMYMKYIRQILPEIRTRHKQPIILGGHHATAHPEDTFAIPEADAVCIGDGEEVISAYADRIQDGGSFAGIPGLWARNAKDGEVRNESAGFVSDLNQLGALDWDLWDDLDRYFYFLGMLYVQGQRGCPYRCTFCDVVAYSDSMRDAGKQYFRLRDPRDFAAELEEYYGRYAKRGMRLFQIFDPVFTMKDSWVQTFCDEYRRLGMEKKMRYSVFSRLDHLSEEKVRLLARSGCALLRVGIESGDDRVRMEVYGKKIKTDTVRRIFTVAKEGGLDFTAFFILGGPTETRQTFKKTIDLAWELDAARSAFFLFKPFAEPARAQVLESGGWVDERRWDEAETITWGGTTGGADWGPGTAERYQWAAYGLTMGRRWVRMLKRRKLAYFPDLARYFTSGLVAGLDWRYLAMYFHIYEGDNVDR